MYKQSHKEKRAEYMRDYRSADKSVTQSVTNKVLRTKKCNTFDEWLKERGIKKEDVETTPFNYHFYNYLADTK